MGPHTFHIPVMGTGFTIDTPIKIARFGISSVISLVDDALVEQIREHWCKETSQPFEPIPEKHPDHRAARFEAYLNLVDRIVRDQLAELRASPFEIGSELWRYFELLPRGATKQLFDRCRYQPPGSVRQGLEARLRELVVAGDIDVNIMTKLDRRTNARGDERDSKMSDALAALRGFANSSLQGAIVFSAGMNARLYTYTAEFDGFYPDPDGRFEKRVILKVSDFRSAQVQGLFLARRGLWVSEYRIESGLNCGGHAFAGDGLLMGPILDEFQRKKSPLIEKLFAAYTKTLAAKGRTLPVKPPPVRITAQGGVGTCEEDALLREHLGVDSVGWGTPFLLVPEVTNVDPTTLGRLAEARSGDVKLSPASPLGVPFWNLMTSPSEEARRRRLAEGRPGSPCPKGFLASSTEFTKAPLCLASRAFQTRKLEVAEDAERITAKSCICHDLGGGATINYGIDPDATTCVCPGPNIVHFGRSATLEEMIDHIYGRTSLLAANDRPHMFIREVELCLDYFAEEARDADDSAHKHLEKMKTHLLDGIAYYREFAREHAERLPGGFGDEVARLAGLVDGLDPH